MTSNSDKMGLRYVPMAFIEHGVVMLSSVLKSDKAIQTNIQIMRIFTKVRQMLLDTTEIKIDILQIQKKLENHDKNIELVFSYLDELIEKKENEGERIKIGYKKNSPKHLLHFNFLYIMGLYKQLGEQKTNHNKQRSNIIISMKFSVYCKIMFQ